MKILIALVVGLVAAVIGYVVGAWLYVSAKASQEATGGDASKFQGATGTGFFIVGPAAAVAGFAGGFALIYFIF